VPLSDSEEEKVVEDGYGVAKDEAEEGDKGDLDAEIHLDTDPYTRTLHPYILCPYRSTWRKSFFSVHYTPVI